MTEIIESIEAALETKLDALEATNKERDTLTDEFQLKLNLIHMQYLISDIALLRAGIKDLKMLFAAKQ